VGSSTAGFDLQVQTSLPITKLGLLRCERIGLDLTQEAKVEQFVLLLANGIDLSP
jgi:hypothetical protein